MSFEIIAQEQWQASLTLGIVFHPATGIRESGSWIFLSYVLITQLDLIYVYGATNCTISQKAPRFDTEEFHQFIYMYLSCASSLHSLVWIDQLLLGHMTAIILFVLFGFQCTLLDKLLYGKSPDTLLLCVQSTILFSFPPLIPSVQDMSFTS